MVDFPCIEGYIRLVFLQDHIIIYTRIINNINLQNLKRASAFIDINERRVDQVSTYSKEVSPV